MIQQLRGSRALLTGASRGLGALIAERLAEEGVHLVLAARDAGRLEAVRARCAGRGVEAKAVEADVSRARDRERLVREAGEIDILVNNAGVQQTMALVDQTAADVAGQIETNLAAPIDLARQMLPAMLARRRGAIVNISSMSGKSPTPFNAVYAATKYGLNGFTASLRLELEGTGVHAGVVCPSFVGGIGMWADTGCRPPALMREVPPDKVVRGVLAVLHGAGEVLVTPGPMRPLLALRELLPGIEGPLIRRMGILETLKNRAAAARRRGEKS